MVTSGNPIKILNPQPTIRFNEIVNNNQATTVPTFPTATTGTTTAPTTTPAPAIPLVPAAPTPTTKKKR